MEKLSCVIDAPTLVEHIHEIKSWIYKGHVRLVVPLSTIEHVEQLFKDYKQQEIKTSAPPRQRSSLRARRTQYPAFDINPHVAHELLARLGLEKIEHLVTFQQPSEEYSPWKEVGVMVEKEPNREGPTTWAQAALTSLNKAHMVNAADSAKVSSKPKLVARASGMVTPPWKTNKKAPRISPSEVPDVFRPLLSYVLWRLYENVVTRTDNDQLLILTDNPDLYDAARKLDVNAQRIVDFRRSVSAQEVATDLNVFGDLERVFGIREPKPLPTRNGTIHVVSLGDDVPISKIDHIKVGQKDVDEIEVDGKYVDTESRQADSLNAANKDQGGKTIEPQVNGDILEPDNESSIVDPEETTNEDICESVSSAPAEVSVVAELPELIIDVLPKPIVPETQPAIVAVQPPFSVEETGLVATTEDINIDAVVNRSRPSTDVDARSAIGNLVGANAEKSTISNGNMPVPIASFTQTQSIPLPKSQSQTQQSPMHRHSPKVSISSSRRSSNSSPAATQNSVELEDSDEEVVVFNPRLRRMSAQLRPPSQSSPRQANNANNSQQVPQVNAPIIDPDAFGRSFATNTRGYVPNGQRARNSPRGSPRRGLRMNEPHVDYVLRSGATREASRGQGRLWVP
ncbi:hypothetical protein MMC07_002342 [Pseudocyphellaria aurata]|nr:hypothetical protein [Pseudocyphellaria aurata]